MFQRHNKIHGELGGWGKKKKRRGGVEIVVKLISVKKSPTIEKEEQNWH